MPYEIIIKKTETVRELKRGEWTVVDTRPWTDKELDEASRRYGDPAVEFLKREPLKKVLDYTPEREAPSVKETEILRQTVEELNIAAVIKAVNNL